MILLVVVFFTLLAYTLHMAHHAMDQELISWGREQSAAVLGALLLALTGRSHGQVSVDPNPDAAVSVVSTKTVTATVPPASVIPIPAYPPPPTAPLP